MFTVSGMGRKKVWQIERAAGKSRKRTEVAAWHFMRNQFHRVVSCIFYITEGNSLGQSHAQVTHIPLCHKSRIEILNVYFLLTVLCNLKLQFEPSSIIILTIDTFEKKKKKFCSVGSKVRCNVQAFIYYFCLLLHGSVSLN